MLDKKMIRHIIDPLKLHSYKYAEDIFKKISIPNEKNHGMIFLLDWSGSMGDSILRDS